MASPGSNQPVPPRLRLNSGSGGDLLDSDSSSSADGNPRLPTSRSLTGGRAGSLRSASSQGQLYNQIPHADPSELLLPPTRSRPRRFRDDTPTDSRRTSWSSESASSRDSRMGPFHTPFDDSRAPSRAGSDDEGINTQTVSEKYNILPSAGLLLYPEDVEKDDYMHNPDPNDKDGVKCAELFSRRGLVNLGGLTFLTVGIMMLFIGYPVLTFIRRIIEPKGVPGCSGNPLCLSDTTPLLKNIRSGPIDPDTPSSAMTKNSKTGGTMNLVFSDEFNDPGRTFYPGDDPYFAGVNLWYGVTQDLEWYDPDALSTANGTLNIQFDAFPNHNLAYRSGMLQSWNQLCFKGGHVEASISLPGRGDVSGFWPGFWALGNLARAGHPATTDGLWPYSYDDVCDAGITANQSFPDGLSSLPGMRLPACTCDGEDHPSPGISRSAPEIDAIEAQVSPNNPFGAVGVASQSFQVAPFDIFWRPDPAYQEVYDDGITTMNTYQGGVYQQALSGITNLNNDWYNGNAYQTYAFEYSPGASGYASFFVGGDSTWSIDPRSIRENGNIAQRVFPQEPMSLVANFGMSHSFANIELAQILALLPATMRFDYIRVYQDDGDELTCDPDGYPTTEYINQHPEPYFNANLTTWAAAGYGVPKNSFVNGCQSSAEPDASKKRRALWNCQNGRCNG